jgi:putative ABC transport system permease protein
MTPLHLAFLSLTRRKVSSLIALLAIALSVACSGVLLRMYVLSGSRFATMGDAGDAIVGAKAGGIEMLLNSVNGEGSYPDFLPYNLFSSLRAEQNIQFEDGARSQPNYLRSVVPVLFFAQHNGHRVMGTDESFFSRPDSSHSISIAQGHIAREMGEVVVGAALAKREHLALGDSLDVVPWSHNGVGTRVFPLKIVGIAAPTAKVWDYMSFTNIDQAQTILALSSIASHSIWGAKVLNYFFVYLKPGGEKPLRDLINGRTVGQVAMVAEQKQKLEDLTGTGRNLGLLMTAFIIALGALSVAAMLVTRFDAMAIQIAVLRALGYSRRKVSAWLLFEGILLGVVACVIGAMLDAIAFPFFRSMLGAALPSVDTVRIPLLHSAPVWAAAILATVFAVFIPLVRFYRQDVHLSLRSS